MNLLWGKPLGLQPGSSPAGTETTSDQSLGLRSPNCPFGPMWGRASALQPGSSPAGGRPGKILGSRNQSGHYRILFDIQDNSRELIAIPNQMIITLDLPKRTVTLQQSIGSPPRERLQRAKTLRRLDQRCREQMNVIRHDHERMQIVASALVSEGEGIDNQPGNLRLSQEQRSTAARVQQPVHSDECFSRCDIRGRKNSSGRKAVLQAKRDEQRLSDYVPVRQAPFVMSHISSVQSQLHFSQPEPGWSPAAGRRPAPQRICCR